MDHLANVGSRASLFARAGGWPEAAKVTGLLHDLGKAKPEFQAYLLGQGQRASEPHSGEGARYALERLGGLGKLIAYAIAGHHAGLPNGVRPANGRPPTPLSERVKQARRLELPDGISLPELKLPSPLAGLPANGHPNYALHFFTRMLFSTLVDADFLETEAWFDGIEGRQRERGWHGSLDQLGHALDAYLARFAGACGKVNALRAEILAHARSRATERPGFFSLTVPTGGGKTLTSLAFALDHARAHGLERVIFVIPYTSIIEQTAAVFREALADEDAVLEHHASFDWDGLEDPTESERLRLAAQNWDRPVVVTTAVQFFESLHANRPSKCRKLHRLARSVIVLDEAQTLPLHLLRPCLAALRELVRGYGASVVLCTATQPALLREEGFTAPEALARGAVRELAPDPPRLYQALRRVEVKDAGTLSDEQLAERITAREQVLVIVNATEHAQAFFARIREGGGAFHLSTRMTAAHRRAVLAEIRHRLAQGAPVRLVSTSLIEAGVDIDFPEVWRALAGIDSIAQAAGRCNREGRRKHAVTWVFRSSEGFRAPADLEQFAMVGAEVLANYPAPLSLDAVRDYFRQLYWDRGIEQLDRARLGQQPYAILKEIENAGNQFDFPFADIAAAFRMIEGGVPLVITGGEWGLPPDEEDDLRHNPHAGAIARALQSFQVQIPPRRRQALIAAGAAEIWRDGEFGEQFVFLRNPRLYDGQTGLRYEAPEDLGGLIL